MLLSDFIRFVRVFGLEQAAGALRLSAEQAHAVVLYHLEHPKEGPACT